MTSASELFYTRRSRAPRLSEPEPEPNPHPDPHGLHRRRHRGCRARRHLDASGDMRHRLHTGPPPPRRRGPHADYFLSNIEDNTISESAAMRNRFDRLMFRTNDRLPGAVLQAQARVIERLGGISLGSSFSRPSISLDEFAASDAFRIMDFGNREEAPVDLNASDSSLVDLASESDEESSLAGNSSYKRSSGLSKAAFHRLQVEVFQAKDDKNDNASLECSICLDGFYAGDVLIRLHCGHRYHSGCLEPWVRKCGDCPYCRANIKSRPS